MARSTEPAEAEIGSMSRPLMRPRTRWAALQRKAGAAKPETCKASSALRARVDADAFGHSLGICGLAEKLIGRESPDPDFELILGSPFRRRIGSTRLPDS